MREIVDQKLLLGEMFTAAYGTTLGDAETDSLTVENPSDSGVVLVIRTQDTRTDSSATGTYYRGGDISGGTEGGASNDLVGHTGTTGAVVTEGASVSSPDSTTTFPISDAGPSQSVLVNRPPVALRPGESITIEVTSNAADNDTLFLMVFYETERGT